MQVLNFLLWLAIAGFCNAATHFVPDDAETLQLAVNMSGPGDTIQIASGTWSGAEIGSHQLVIVGSGRNSCVLESAAGSGRVLTANDSPTLHISNLSLANALADQVGEAAGAGLYALSSSIELVNISMINNQALFGGALALLDCNTRMEACSLRYNTADVGGAIYIEGGSLELNSSWLGNNLAGGASMGGALCLEQADAFVSHSVFLLNQAQTGGALALRMLEGTSIVRLETCSFSMNSATHGAAVYVLNGNPVIERCILAESVAGPGISCQNALPDITCTVIHGNAGGDDFCGSEGQGNLQQNPLFCDPQLDLRLQDDSPCWSSPCGIIGAMTDNCDGVDVPPGNVQHAKARLPHARLAGTTLRLELDQMQELRVTVFDLLGRQLMRGYTPVLTAGAQHVDLRQTLPDWDLLPAGFLVMHVEGESFDTSFGFSHLK